MAEDEEILRKGSSLYNYLRDNGFSNFECYELENQNRMFLPKVDQQELNALRIPKKAPQWITNNINCILKSGLILEDHRHFIEQFYPVETEESSNSRCNSKLYCVPLLCLGGLWKLAHTPVSKVLLGISAGIGTLYVAFRFRDSWTLKHYTSLTTNLKLTVVSLEKLFVHYKKMLQLIHQNDFISHNTSLSHREMFELKRKLLSSLLGTIEVFDRFLDGIKKIPLSIEVNVVLQSYSFEDLHSGLNIDDEESCSYENLKKIFNSYILVQSEFLRRFALCHCPDVWTEHTLTKTLLYCQSALPEVLSWSTSVHKYLIQELKLFRTIIECKRKGSQLRAPSSCSWEYSDIYVLVRSACVHFQSLFIQTQGLQEILESSYGGETKGSEDLLKAAAQILTEISREIHLGQVCVDTSLAQIFKMSNPCQSTIKLKELEDATLTVEEPVQTFNTDYYPPVQDEIFELTVHHDGSDLSDDEEWDDIAEDNLRKKTGETSKVVFEELKTVLVKKAEEWKEREKRAMESKGLPYTDPLQADSQPLEDNFKENINITNAGGELGFLPTNSQSDWPLPRLKRILKTHRSVKGKTSQRLESNLSEQSSSHDSIRGGTENMGCAKVGFGGSLLAEAMAKSRAMHSTREEEIFLGSESDSSSAEC